MQKNQTIPDGIINPFSENFLSTWELWKKFRWEEHKFKYKGCTSEQVKLMQLAELADRDEQTAIQIVMQSIGNGWSGLYKLKTVSLNAKQTTASPKETRQSLNDLYSQRFGK